MNFLYVKSEISIFIFSIIIFFYGAGLFEKSGHLCFSPRVALSFVITSVVVEKVVRMDMLVGHLIVAMDVFVDQIHFEQ